MNFSICIRQVIDFSPLCLLASVGFTVFASPVSAQVFESGPSDSALFDNVINLPSDPIGDGIGGDGLTTQLNVSAGAIVGNFFTADSGSEVNIARGVTVEGFFSALAGSEVNVSGGATHIGHYFSAREGSQVNINGGSFGGLNSGGSVTSGFHAYPGAEVNLVGASFFLDDVRINDSLSTEDAFTIVDRNVTLSGFLADRSRFSFNLNSTPPSGISASDYFDTEATLTVRLSPDYQVVLGDTNGDGHLSFLDIDWFTRTLASGNYLAEADINQDDEVNFLDIQPLIDLLSNN